jgi:6-carboxyhexanoate--CoA ligase
MRAAALSGNHKHLSGAECITDETMLAGRCESLVTRALSHERGEADEITITIEHLDEKHLTRIAALPVTTRRVDTPEEGHALVIQLLEESGILRAREIFALLPETYGMRGALLVDADSLQRLEPDRNRGVRVTRMDAMETGRGADKAGKNHFREALVLASKTAAAPGIIGEICVSDDPAYQTGYIASKKLGYVRITPLKAMNDPSGGRIFIYRGEKSGIDACIDYLQKKPVLVLGVPEHPPANESTAALTVSGSYEKWQPLREAIDAKKHNRLYRSVRLIESAAGPQVQYKGQRCLMLASNNYLNIAGDARLVKAAAKAGSRYGWGSGGSRLTTGTTPVHCELEEALANWKESEAALLFNTGYMANVGVISALGNNGVILSDERNHASIIDGCRLSGARVVIYRHNDMDDLSKKASLYAGNPGIIVSDSVFSMDGDIVNLPRLVDIAERYGFFSMIDEAHGSGCLGETGRGASEYFGVKPDIIVGTCSKALGSEGGFVCGPHILIDYLINHARSFIFSTAPPAPLAAATLAGLHILQTEPERVAQLRKNSAFFCMQLRARGIETSSQTPIVPITLYGDSRQTSEEKALAVSARLLEAGFFIPAIRYPTVPKGAAMLRAVLCSAHSTEQLENAAMAIYTCLQDGKPV